jgi:MFS family permease
MSFYSEMWQWYISGAIIGLSGGVYFMVGGAIIDTNWFAKRTAFAMGIMTIIGAVGAAILSPIHAAVIAAVGWRTAYLIVAAISLIIALPWILGIIRYQPSDKGVKPVGYIEGMESIVAGDDDAKGTSVKGGVLSIAFIAIFLGAGLCALFGGFQNLWPTFAADWGYDSMVGATMISCTLIFGVMIPVVGALIDKFGVSTMCAVLLIVQMLGGLGLIFFHGVLPILYVCVFLFACQAALLLLVMPITIRTLFGARNFTKLHSYCQIGLGLIGGLSAPIISSVAVYFGNYTAAMWFGVGLAAVALILWFSGYFSGRRLTWTDGTHPNIFAKKTAEEKTA